MGKIKVQKTGDWWPGRSSKEYKDNYDTMQWDHDAPEGEGEASGHPKNKGLASEVFRPGGN